MTERRRGVLLSAVAAVIAVYLMVPAVMTIPMSFTERAALDFPPKGFSLRWYEELFSDPQWMEAAGVSLRVAVLTTLISTVLGTAAALALARSTFRGRALVSAVIFVPLIVPVIIVALACYLAFLPRGFVGNTWGLAIAHSVLALPFVVTTVVASLRTVPPGLELAAAGLGANPWKVFRKITLPLILPGVAAGALFAFITSWDEVVIGLFMTGPGFKTLPVLIWGEVRLTLYPTIAAASSLLIVISTAGLLATTLLRRGQRA